MDLLEMNIAAYGNMHEHLECSIGVIGAVLHDRKLAGVYGSYERAHRKAIGRFGAGQCLIAEVGRRVDRQACERGADQSGQVAG